MVVSGRLILHLLLFCCTSLQALGSRVNIVTNGYRDIVVAISPDVSPDQADELLNKIKVCFSNLFKLFLILWVISICSSRF